jgi:glutamyl-tRNA reductase
MQFLAVGVNHRTAPVALRECLAFPEKELGQAVASLRAQPDIEEAVLLSTCNRVEVWAISPRAAHGERSIHRFLQTNRKVETAALEGALFVHHGQEALLHIFRVTSSLDAMVVGEAQIAGQVKDAFALASQARTVGPLLTRCLHRALAAAKRVRTETDIARHPVSISSVAADLAGRVFGDLSQSQVLVVGAGEMAELAVRHLLGGGASAIHVVNRTYEKAVSLAFELGARAHRFDELRAQLLFADIVISSTGSEKPILTRSFIAEVQKQRKQRPLFIIDIAVPRDVERGVGELSNVFSFDIDDLEQVVAENLKARQKEARAAEAILEVEVAHFEDWLRQQGAVPVIKALRGRFQEVVRTEAERTAHALHLDTGEGGAHRAVLEAMTEAIVNKLLHAPSTELKRLAASADGVRLSRAASRLFGLEPSLPDEAPGEAPALAEADAGAEQSEEAER